MPRDHFNSWRLDEVKECGDAEAEQSLLPLIAQGLAKAYDGKVGLPDNEKQFKDKMAWVRDQVHLLRRLQKEMTGRVRSLRFFEKVRELQVACRAPRTYRGGARPPSARRGARLAILLCRLWNCLRQCLRKFFETSACKPITKPPPLLQVNVFAFSSQICGEQPLSELRDVNHAKSKPSASPKRSSPAKQSPKRASPSKPADVDSGVLSCCGHTGKLSLLRESAERQECPVAGCRAAVRTGCIVPMRDLGREVATGANGSSFGAKLSCVLKLIKRIPEGERILIFVQFVGAPPAPDSLRRVRASLFASRSKFKLSIAFDVRCIAVSVIVSLQELLRDEPTERTKMIKRVLLSLLVSRPAQLLAFRHSALKPRGACKKDRAQPEASKTAVPSTAACSRLCRPLDEGARGA
eukprot:1835309-Pleurochrysis_carterae.AAC.3